MGVAIVLGEWVGVRVVGGCHRVGWVEVERVDGGVIMLGEWELAGRVGLPLCWVSVWVGVAGRWGLPSCCGSGWVQVGVRVGGCAGRWVLLLCWVCVCVCVCAGRWVLPSCWVGGWLAGRWGLPSCWVSGLVGW